MKKWLCCVALLSIANLNAGIETYFKKAENKSDLHKINGVDFIYLINSDENPEKYERSLNALRPYNINPYRFSAVDGMALSFSALDELGIILKHPAAYGPIATVFRHENGQEYPSFEIMKEPGVSYYSHSLSRGAIGTILSHLSVLQDAYDSGYNTIWIMEDHIKVVSNPHELSSLIYNLDSLAPDWDIFFTDNEIKGAHGPVPCMVTRPRPFLELQPLEYYLERKTIHGDLIKIGMRFGSTSMLVRRSGIKKILDFFQTYKLYFPYDIDSFFVPGINIYAFNRDIVTNLVGQESANAQVNSSTLLSDKPRIDILPGQNFYDLPIDLTSLQQTGLEIRVSNQFFNGKDTAHYSIDIADDSNLKKIIVLNNTVDPFYLAQMPKEKLALFLIEPLLLPDSYYDACSRVYTWDDDKVDGVKFFKLYYPYLRPMLPELPPFEEKKLCIMVSGSDNEYPERRNELYSERMRMVEFFETKPPGEFDVYGRYWVKRYYRDFRGPIPGGFSGDEKIEVMKNYKFSICFENTKEINGYITEKIFSCFGAGCIPVYWGAGNIEQFIPKECFIDYRDFRSREELYQFMKKMPKDVYQKYIDNIRIFLDSEEAQLFSPLYFGNLIYEAVMK